MIALAIGAQTGAYGPLKRQQKVVWETTGEMFSSTGVGDLFGLELWKPHI